MERKSIGAFLAILRKANGMTQQQVADRLNVSNKTVSKWERDETLPDITLIPALAEMYHVTSDEILRGQRIDQESEPPEKTAQKTDAQAKSLIARTLNRHLSWTTLAASLLAVGMIALFTVSYAFYRPALGFGLYLTLLLAGLATGFLAMGTARTALTGGDVLAEDSVRAAERQLLSRWRRLIAGAVVTLIWALPLIIFRHDVYVDSVITLSGYLELTPFMAVLSALSVLLSNWIFVRCQPMCAEDYNCPGDRLRRLYLLSGCLALLMIMVALVITLRAANEIVEIDHQVVEVRFANTADGEEYLDAVADFDMGGTAWKAYWEENMQSHGLPWKGEISEDDRVFLKERYYLTEDALQDRPEYCGWAFIPTSINAASTQVDFEFSTTTIGNADRQRGAVLALIAGLAAIAAVLALRRKVILAGLEQQ